ncbi:hypothetical protein GCM10007385_42040 [Tateyamaria omphalii]|nr:hypothetical protein [Tateyamaria omphalii]GGX68514.1 hypothetical protein GCM10007385_42040 [Tateyamaria omphalii]
MTPQNRSNLAAAAMRSDASAFASDSRNQSTVAQNNMISFFAPVQRDDQLTDIATEGSLIGRNGIYDVRATNQDDLTVAEMRGFSRAIKGHLFDETDGEETQS